MSKKRLLEQKKKYEEWKKQRDARENSGVDTEESVCEEPHEQVRPSRPDEASLQGNSERERQRAENRRKYPEFAAFFDEVQKHFPGAKVVRIIQNPTPATHLSDVEDAQDDPQFQQDQDHQEPYL